jgi:hypothetical protein
MKVYTGWDGPSVGSRLMWYSSAPDEHGTSLSTKIAARPHNSTHKNGNLSGRELKFAR